MSLTITALSRPHLAGPIDLHIPAGSICALCGPNGAGKTTLIRAAAGLTAGDGKILLAGTDIARLSRSGRARRLAYLPADRPAQWPLKVSDIVALGLQSEDEGRVASAMERTETSSFADRRVDTLSTGERARVLFARALVGAPAILLLDEPAANLDPGHQLDVMRLLREEADRGAAILVSLHDLTLARAHADIALLLNRGRQIGFGAVAETLSDDSIAAVFGVRTGKKGWQRA